MGSAVTLPCVLSPGLAFTKMALEKTGGPERLLLTNEFVRPRSLDKSFTIQEVTMEDQGQYRCAGTVRGHSLNRTMQLVVAKSKFISTQFKEKLS